MVLTQTEGDFFGKNWSLGRILFIQIRENGKNWAKFTELGGN